MRFADVSAGPFIAGVRVFGNELRETFIEPARDRVGVKPVQHEMDDFVAEQIVAEFVGGISLDEKTAPGMNSAGPLFQVAVGLKLLPIFGALENINVRFDIG